jgi:hypothetical protein
MNTTAPLMLGSATTNTNTLPTDSAPAYGTIYWAKYWNEDLGAAECR